MPTYKICVVSSCACPQMVIVAEYLEETLSRAGYRCRVTHQCTMDIPMPPYSVNLVLELSPAFKEADTGCPVISIRPMLLDHLHAPTLEKIMQRVQADYPALMV